VGSRSEFASRGAPGSAVPVGGRRNWESPQTLRLWGSYVDLPLPADPVSQAFGLACGDPPLPKGGRSLGRRFNSHTWELLRFLGKAWGFLGGSRMNQS
jgi:hypothetical protein